MTTRDFKRLFEPIQVGKLRLRNRLFSSGYDPMLGRRGRVTDPLLAYAEQRAAGGISLLITGEISVHASNYIFSQCLMIDDDVYVDGLREYAEVCHRHDCRIFGQLGHQGRLLHYARGGGPPISYSASSAPTEHEPNLPLALPAEMIEELLHAFADGAARLALAGFDGAEILSSHGYLPAQFLNPRLNQRTDEYGGSFENRMRFLRRLIEGVREAVDDTFVVGMRISGDEMDHDGLGPDEVAEVCQALDADGALDYFNVCAGSEQTARGQMYYIPPMSIEQGYTAPFAKRVRDVVDKPVFVVGRINDPQIANRILEQGQADLCGMARALICDPELPRKTFEGRLDDIRVCIGCNQACVGRLAKGRSISCIQYPESGRELRYGTRQPAERARRVLVVGGGPAGMKAAAVAAERGHAVTLFERGTQLGGQALLAQRLPGRAEFGGIAQNLAREMERARVEVRTKTDATRALIEAERPDVVVLATGARPRIPVVEGADEGHVVSAWQVLTDKGVGARVLVADWRGDWVGCGVAQLLAGRGHAVRLATSRSHAAADLENNTQCSAVGELFRLGVEVIPNARLFGVDAESVYLQHTITNDPIVCEGVDSLVLATGHEPVCELADALAGLDAELVSIGDCITPRTAEEAVLEGLEAAVAI